MAALIHTAPFQGCLKQCSKSSGVQRRLSVCRAEVREEGAWMKTASVSLLAAGLAASVLISLPPPADAGVVYEQPKLKRGRQFQKSDKPEEPTSEQTQSSSGGGLSLPSLPSLPTPSLPSPSLPSSFPFPSLPEVDTSGGIDPRSIALPGAVAGIAAAGYAAYSLDGGFRSMIRESLVKDSTGYAGYEESIKEQYMPNGANMTPMRGTKKVGAKPSKKTASGKGKGGKGKETKKGGPFGLFS